MKVEDGKKYEEAKKEFETRYRGCPVQELSLIHI